MVNTLFVRRLEGLGRALTAASCLGTGALLASGAATAADLAYHAGIVQGTAYGQVSGLLVNDDKTLLWRGVPYAKAPVGDLRWKASEKPDAWTGVRDATEHATLCTQIASGEVAGDEDCLNADIYRPNSDETGLPVLVYIHGGNNQTGTSEEINAEQLAVNANAVVVSVNYRLGLLGFNNLPALKTGDNIEDSGNFTLLDISRSLQWLKANIAAFGGNSENITVAGFSAGGRDVMAMLISPIFAGEFQKAISFSGGMTLADAGESAKLIARAIAPLVVEDKIKASEDEAYDWLLTSGADVGDYLDGLSAGRLAGLMSNAGIRMAVFPHLYNDGTVLPENGFDTASYNSVPLIMMTGSQEFSLFARYDAEFAGQGNDELLADAKRLAELKFAAGYGSKLYELFNAQESAQRMFDHYEAPIYTVRMAWGSDPAIVGEPMATLFGAFHGVWIPFVTDRTTGFSGLFPDAFANPGAKDLGGQFGSYIRNFLWSGDPNGEGLTRWKPWTGIDSGPTQLILDAGMDKANVTMSEERTAYDDVLKAIDADTSIAPEQKRHLIETVLDGRWFSLGLDRYYGNTNPWVQVE
ncbi:carboxylesterase family protein [Consotaella aegiceratis]|uniref:carboxylesterase family protein n=1 Tax=Consotaella aegiceratis TaxID=3097961 RepID=UPI002F42F6CE